MAHGAHFSGTAYSQASVSAAEGLEQSLGVGKARPTSSPIRVVSYLVAFLLPVLILVVVSRWSGVYPFGAESFLTEDLKYQYIDFFTWYRSVLVDGQSLFYSLSQSLGNNTWGIFSYYLASPFSLLVAFFDADHLVLAIYVMVALKLGCIGLANYWYLRRRFGLGALVSLAIATCCCWSSWVATQLRNPMWLDCFIFLPLVAYGMWRFVREDRWGLLLAGLALSIITCWYMGYMVVIFSLLLATYELVDAGASRPQVERLAFRYAGVLCLVVLLSAWTFYPTVAAMLSSWSLARTVALVAVSAMLLALAHLSLGVELPGKVYRIFSEVALGVAVLGVAVLGVVGVTAQGITAVFPGHLDRLRTADLGAVLSGLVAGGWKVDLVPQLFAGTVLLVCSLGCLLSRSVPRPTKRVFAAVMLVMLLSVVFTPFEYIWCGFREPRGFYSRPAAFVGFTLLWLTAWLLAKYRLGEVADGLRKAIVVAAGLSLSALVFGANYNMRATILGCAGLAFLAAVVWLLAGRIDHRPDAAGNHPARLVSARAAAGALVLVFCVVEAAYLGRVSWSFLYVGYPQDEHEQFVSDSRQQLAELSKLDDSVYRFDKTYTRANASALNEGMALGFNQVSSYTSASNQTALNFLNSLGYSTPGEFSTRYAAPVLLLDTLFDVRYASLLSDEPEPIGMEDAGISPTSDGMRVYKNPYATSVGYGAVGSLSDAALTGSNPFELQNSFVQTVIDLSLTPYEELESTQTVDEAADRSWTLTVPEGSIGYVYLQAPDEAGYLLSIDGADAIYDGWRFQNTLYAMKPGKHTVTVAAPSGAFPDDFETFFYGLSVDALQQVSDELGQRQFQPTTFGGNRIAGSYDASQDGDLLLTVPYDYGWSLTVNGAKVAPTKVFGGALMAVPVTSGTNDIELTYTPPMLWAGCAVSALTALSLLARSLRMRGAGDSGTFAPSRGQISRKRVPSGRRAGSVD